MNILIVCLEGNSSWALMAQAFLLKSDPTLEVHVAVGSEGYVPDQLAERAMKEIGLELQQPSSHQEFEGKAFDYLITICQAKKGVAGKFNLQARHEVHLVFDINDKIHKDQDSLASAYCDLRDEIRHEFEYFYQRILSAERQKTQK